MKALLVGFMLALAGCGQAGSSTPPIANIGGDEIVLTGRVVDQAEIVPSAEEASISGSLEALEHDTTDQFVIVTLRDLHGAQIEQVSRSLGNEWGIGRKDIDNGVLLVVAPKERQVRIQVGYGLEALLTNQRAAQIIAHMLPSFRLGDSPGAIKIGVNDVEAVLRSDLRRPQYLKKAA